MKTQTSQASRTKVAPQVVEGAAKKAKYLVQRENRQRYSFGPVWQAAVVDGKVTDHEKLIAHAVKLKVAARYQAKKLRFETLLAKVQAALTGTVNS